MRKEEKKVDETKFKKAEKKDIRKAWELTKKRYSKALEELGK